MVIYNHKKTAGQLCIKESAVYLMWLSEKDLVLLVIERIKSILLIHFYAGGYQWIGPDCMQPKANRYMVPRKMLCSYISNATAPF